MHRHGKPHEINCQTDRQKNFISVILAQLNDFMCMWQNCDLKKTEELHVVKSYYP